MARKVLTRLYNFKMKKFKFVTSLPVFSRTSKSLPMMLLSTAFPPFVSEGDRAVLNYEYYHWPKSNDAKVLDLLNISVFQNFILFQEDL